MLECLLIETSQPVFSDTSIINTLEVLPTIWLNISAWCNKNTYHIAHNWAAFIWFLYTYFFTLSTLTYVSSVWVLFMFYFWHCLFNHECLLLMQPWMLTMVERLCNLSLLCSKYLAFFNLQCNSMKKQWASQASQAKHRDHVLYQASIFLFDTVILSKKN